MIKKNTTTNYIEDLSSEEDYDYNGICEEVSGTPISSFNFTEKNTPNEPFLNSDIDTSSFSNNDSLPDNRKLKTKAAEITPPINGEPLDTQRCYKIRNSTARMLIYNKF